MEFINTQAADVHSVSKEIFQYMYYNGVWVTVISFSIYKCIR